MEMNTSVHTNIIDPNLQQSLPLSVHLTVNNQPNTSNHSLFSHSFMNPFWLMFEAAITGHENCDLTPMMLTDKERHPVPQILDLQTVSYK